MAICTKNFTMETKTCGIDCNNCEYYDTRNKKERINAAAIENGKKFRAQMEIDLKEFIPPRHCDEGCKYLCSEGHGFCDTCEATGKAILRFSKMSDICPFWKNRTKEEK